MSVLLDTSVLCRLANSNDADFPVASAAISELHRRRTRICCTPQNFVEFRNVATRPIAMNGFGLNATAADQLAAVHESSFHFLPDIPGIFPSWKDLVAKAGVIGKQVHDARLVAVCHAHQIDQLLTFNVGHFTRLAAFGPPLTILDPLSFLPPASAIAP
jgi:predicted nucleic acid-binding protein